MTTTPQIVATLMEAAQAQKHVVFNEALYRLDAIAQINVISAVVAAPPGAPVEGDKYIVPAAATGAWVGQTNKIAWFHSGAWSFLTAKAGWLTWNVATGAFVSWSGAAWVALPTGGGGGGPTFPDDTFAITDNLDATKIAKFEVSGLTTGTTRTFTFPDVTGTLALLGGTQTFDGAKTFSGTFVASGASVSLGTVTGTSTVNLGIGATLTATAKTINLGTGGASGSTTTVNIGSTTGGALGDTIINTPTVTFAATVTAIAAAAANLSVLRAGIGGATADATNRLSINTPAVLLNNAGTSIEATVNKNAAANDAAFAFKTGFSTRALIGLLASDDFTVKVSPDGSAFFDAFTIARATGRVDFLQPVVLTSVGTGTPALPVGNDLTICAVTRRGGPVLSIQSPSGRNYTPHRHEAFTRALIWLPSNTTTITTEGSTLVNIGTVSTPSIASTNLLTSARRFRLTSAAVIDSVSETKSANGVCLRGAAAGIGGFYHVSRISLTTLQATGMAFFGLMSGTTTLAVTTALSAIVSAIGIGFQRGTHTNWQLVTNDATGAPTLTDMGASFAIATGDLYTLQLYAVPNAASIWVRVVNEVTLAVFESEVTTDLVANTAILAPRMFMNNGATAAAVAFECSGVYVETDY